MTAFPFANDRFGEKCMTAGVKGCPTPAHTRTQFETPPRPGGRRRTSLKGGNRGVNRGAQGEVRSAMGI